MDFLWVLVWLVLSDVVFSSGLDRCEIHESNSLQSVSSLLESLQCYNDYMSYVQCKWKKHENSTSLQVRFKTPSSSDTSDEDPSSGSKHVKKSELCVSNEAEDGSAHCRYETDVFTVGTSHFVFFLNNQMKSLCSSDHNNFQDLIQHLKARPPVNLSSFEEDDGGQRLQWSNPYSSSSSSLNRNLMYQLSYRMQTQNNWTTENVLNTSLKLEGQILLPGYRYEARVRALASLGQWSNWSPVVTWQTRDAPDIVQVPSLDCLLDGENEVTCSWEVSTDLDHLLTYQLTCRHNRTARSERCCQDQTVSSEPGGTAVRYSCSLTIADPEHLQLNLLPEHRAKIFKAHQNIRPNPPQQVTVNEIDGNWIVEWTDPATDVRLSYQVWYYRTDDPENIKQLKISEGSRSVGILGTSLLPLQEYQVKVRSLVNPGMGSQYEGIPSEWTDPVKWTSEATSPLFNIIYVFIVLFVVGVFLTLYCTIPACQRKVVLWVDSVPSPGKSKILSEIKFATSLTLMQNEKTTICKVQHLNSISTCNSEALLWPFDGTETKHVDDKFGYWNSSPEKVNCSDTSSMGFSGPYITCQVPESMFMPGNVQQEEKDKETSSEEVPSCSFLAPSPFNDKDYVCLPSHIVQRSTEDLTSHSNTSPQWFDIAEQKQRWSETKPWSVGSDDQSSRNDPPTNSQPSDYTSGPPALRPQVSELRILPPPHSLNNSS